MASNHTAGEASTSKDAFAKKWCEIFTALVQDSCQRSPEEIPQAVQSIKLQEAAFDAEAQVKGFKHEDFAPDIKYILEYQGKPYKVPGDEGACYTHPFYAARMALGCVEHVANVLAREKAVEQ